MATETDLALAVMQELAVIPNGSLPTAQDYADIKLRYERRLVMLQDEDFADWDANNIPDAAMPGLTRLMAYEVAPLFSVPRAQLMESGMSWEEKGMMMLRRYMRKKPTYEAVMADYF